MNAAPPRREIHPSAICQSSSVGRDCRIGPLAVVGPQVRLGDRCTVGAGAVLAGPVTLADGVVVGEGAVVGSAAAEAAPVVVGAGAEIGARAVVPAGRRVGGRAVVAAGAVLDRDVSALAVVAGNPARVTGFADTPQWRPAADEDAGAVVALPVGGASLHRLPQVTDPRGCLAFGQTDAHLPFTPQRFFTVFGVPADDVRGEHAHLRCHQFLLCATGTITAVVDDGRSRCQVVLDQPNMGLYMPPMTWGTQYRYSPGSVLLVFASHHYEAADYVRDYAAFLEVVRQGEAAPRS